MWGKLPTVLKNSFLYLILFPVPFLWAILSFAGYLDGFKDAAMDWRFRVRGEVESPAKIIYADLDARAMNLDRVGERPWDRQFFAEAGFLLLEYGQARVVGFDFVFSPKSMSRMVSDQKVVESNQNIASLIQRHPDRIVLAGDYTGVLLPYMELPSTPPLKYMGFDNPRRNPYPEIPTFPIINIIQGQPVGRVGLITVDESLSRDAIARWCPLYFEYEGGVHSKNLLFGKQYNFGVQGLQTEIVETEDHYELQFQGNTVDQLPKSTQIRFHHFALELYLASQGLQASAVNIFEDQLEIRDENEKVLKEIPLTRQQLLEINYFSPWESKYNPRVSLAQLFANEPKLFSDDPEEVAEAEAFYRQFIDAIVLIGPTDILLQDLAPTPFDAREVPRVGVHGNLLKTIISERFIHRLGPFWEYFFLFGLTALSVAAGLYSGRQSLFFKVATVFMIGGYIGAVFFLFGSEDLVLPLVSPVGSAASTLFLGTIGKLVLEERQKGKIKGMFGTYVSPELVESMVESGREPQLGGHEEDITAFFSDIQSFSSFSEKLTPGDLVSLMNDYLTQMTDIIQEEKGTLDKYIGDAIVAMFGAPVDLPTHAAHGCQAAIRIQLKQAELRQRWEKEGERWPQIVHRMQTRIGLNSGNAIVGNMGSINRFNYTMMGDVVNLAARSESGAKTYGVYTMVTEDTKTACEKNNQEMLFRFLDKIVVKGRSRPVSMYELVDFKTNITSQEQKGIDLYHEAVENYLMQRWDHAHALFEEAARYERHNPQKVRWIQTNPSLVMVARCLMMKQHPPGPDWDGVYKMTSK